MILLIPTNVANKFTQAGDSFGVSARLGTNDAFALEFETNNILRGSVSNTGLWAIGGPLATATQLAITQDILTTGSPTALLVTSAAHTTLTASVESIGINLNLSATKQFSTGALATQREVLFQAPTYGFVLASTITTAATVAISAAPIAGTNTTITTPLALWVQSGETRLVGSGTGTTTYGLQVHNSSGTNNALVVRDDGFIGMGTSAPAGKLQVFGSGTGSVLIGEYGGSNGYGSISLNGSLAAGSGANISSGPGDKNLYINVPTGNGVQFQINASIVAGYNSVNQWFLGSTSATSPVRLGLTDSGSAVLPIQKMFNNVAAANNSAAQLLFAANRTTSGETNVAGIGGMITDITDGAYKGALVFYTTDNTSTPSERGRIDYIGSVSFAQGIATTGTPTAFLVTGGAHTTLTASVESIGANFNFSATKQFATGALTTQREVLFQAPTYGFVAASTITTAATVAISAAPIAGTNATLTNSSALWVQAGASRLDGRLLENQGADVASGTNLTLGSDGNVFEITGTTQIDLILITEWRNGTVVTLVFNESVTVRHAIATSGSNVTILLAGAANFSATANDTLTLVLCETTAGGQAWRELARTAI